LFAQALKEIFLGLLQVGKGTVLLEPSPTSVAVVSDCDGFGAVEDNCHVFIKIRKIVDRLGVELLFIKQKQWQK
jgi:hypothetical protein